jgi:N-sulfoglucosamine sulfohydrolase
MNRFKQLVFTFTSAVVVLAGSANANTARPNVLFIIADDASRHFGESNHCDWVKTPNIDRLAREGLVFDNAYTPTSKCAPSRSSILTGRNPWQLEDAANHQPIFPTKFVAFSEVMAAADVVTSGGGKVWGPGIAAKADGSPRGFDLEPTVAKGKQSAFESFLSARIDDKKPFFYWFGSKNPHRPYQLNAGVDKGKTLRDIPKVPGYWPDNETVRGDMLDYATEVEAFDEEVGQHLKALEKAGFADNTLVIVTSDHGMPFPRVKGHTYEEAHHIPMVARWPAGIKNPGRRISEFVSFIDLAPTFLELFGLEGTIDGASGAMAEITGKSFTDLLKDSPSQQRSFVIFGRERNDVSAREGTPYGLGYPVRAIREGNLVYIHNFKADRWPCGDPELGLKDTDNGPTKQFIEGLGMDSVYWQHAFGIRPTEQLFDVVADPDCVTNLADLPKYEKTKADLKDRLIAELVKQQDPRVLGNGDVFDHYVGRIAAKRNAGAATPKVDQQKQRKKKSSAN